MTTSQRTVVVVYPQRKSCRRINRGDRKHITQECNTTCHHPCCIFFLFSEMISFPAQHEIFHAYIGRITPHSSRCIADMWHSAHFLTKTAFSIMETLLSWILQHSALLTQLNLGDLPPRFSNKALAQPADISLAPPPLLLLERTMIRPIIM